MLESRILRWAAIFLLGFIVIGFAHASILRQVAFFLITEDSLRPASAIIPLGGLTPFREMEAAQLYRAGLAPRVVIVGDAPSDESEALEKLGIKAYQRWELSRAVLIQQGVPASAIIIASGKAGGTLEELQAAYSAMTTKDAAVILVTSKYHTRRTRLTWRYVSAGRSQPIVRAASGDPFDPNQWWHKRSSVLSIVHEYLGLVYYYVRFAVAR